MSEDTEQFLAKIDDFARGLDPAEQAAFVELLGGGGEVVGFTDDWPGVRNILAPGLTAQIDGILLPSRATSGNVASTAGADPDQRNFGSTAGGDPNV